MKAPAQIYPNKTLEKRRSLVRFCDDSRTNLVPLRFDASESGFWKDKFAQGHYLLKL